MSIAEQADGRPWLLIDAARQGVLRFATCVPSARPRLGEVRDMEIASLPTFTDALQQFERSSGVALRGMECAMAVAGATAGEAFSLVRSRWTVTRSGLAAVFGRPVTILNDVAARAWAIRSATARLDLLLGRGLPNLDRAGRYILLMVEEGVGAAVIDVDANGVVRILDSEAGHMDFAPTTDVEARLAAAARGTSPMTGWERMLMLDRHDPLWASACPELRDAERAPLIAGLLGRFAVNLMLSTGAWDGVLIAGERGTRLVEGASRAGFASAFDARRSFKRLISATSAWTVNQRDAVLMGAAERLAQDFRLAQLA